MSAVRPAGTTGYDKVASALLSTRLSFDEVHRHVLHLIPVHPARVLDVGSGPGHDAATLASRGHAVTAVEPTPELRDGARALYSDLPIEWVDDSLPALGSLAAAHAPPFDFILVEGVWAHLTAAERVEACPVLAGLLAEQGVLAISLRHGPAAPGRITHPVEDRLDPGRQHRERRHLDANGFWRSRLKRIRPVRPAGEGHLQARNK